MKKTFSRLAAVLFAALMAVCFVLQTGTVTFADETVDYKGKNIVYHDATHDGVGEGLRVEDGEKLGYGPGTLVITCDYADNEPDPQWANINGHICEYYPQLLITLNAVYDYQYKYISDQFTFEYLRGNPSDLYWDVNDLFDSYANSNQWKYAGINGTEYPESNRKPSKPGTYEVRAPWKVEDKTYTITRHFTISPEAATLLVGPGIFSKEVKTGKPALWLDGTP